MILIVDSGSTKCDWVAVDKKGNQLLEKIRTKGLNPTILSKKKLLKTVKKSKTLINNCENVTNIYFYGAGCGTENPRLALKVVLQQIFKNANIEVNEDTLAAVYATINTPDEAAVVCILGTGSNCSYYNGEKLEQRVASLGYALMDDASGNYFGKHLIRDYYFNHMPENIKIAFANKYNLEANFIKFNLYQQPNPNAYLANFAEFMILNKDSKYIKKLIKDGIRIFAKNMMFQFKEELKTVPVHFAGSIAFFCQDEIREIAKELSFKIGNFERRPIEGLVSFHTNKGC